MLIADSSWLIVKRINGVSKDSEIVSHFISLPQKYVMLPFGLMKVILCCA